LKHKKSLVINYTINIRLDHEKVVRQFIYLLCRLSSRGPDDSQVEAHRPPGESPVTTQRPYSLGCSGLPHGRFPMVLGQCATPRKERGARNDCLSSRGGILPTKRSPHNHSYTARSANTRDDRAWTGDLPCLVIARTWWFSGRSASSPWGISCHNTVTLFSERVLFLLEIATRSLSARD